MLFSRGQNTASLCQIQEVKDLGEEEKKQFHTLKVLFGIYTLEKWVEKEECVPTEIRDCHN